MDLLRIPKKLYFKRGCLPVALKEMHEVYGLKSAFLVTAPGLFRDAVARPVDQLLNKGGLGTCEFFTLTEAPTIANMKTGLQKMDEFQPDLIVGIGDEAALSAAKIMWLMYENPDVDVATLADGAAFPQLGTKAKLVLVPTGDGNAIASAPYAAFADENGKKVWLKNYELIPEMSVIDPDLTDYADAAIIKAEGLAALKNAVAAVAAPAKLEYCQGFALDAAKMIMENLEKALAGGTVAPDACDKVANAATLAGMAYACATIAEAPLDAAKTIEELVADDKAAADDMAAKCGLADAAALVAEYNKLAAL